MTTIETHVAKPSLWELFWAVVRKEALLNRRDPLLLVMIFAFPVVLVAFLSSSLGGAFALDRVPPYVLVGHLAPAVSGHLGAPQATLALTAARERVAAGTVAFAVVADSDGAVRSVVADPTAQILLPAFLNAMNGSAPSVETPDGRPYRSAASPYAQTLLGFVLYHAFFAASHAAQAMHRERNWGTWNRLLGLHMPKALLLAAKMVPTLGIVLVQGLVLIGGGCLLLGIPVHHWVLLAVGYLLVGLCVTAVGALLAALARNDMQVPQMNNLLVLLGGVLGGALVPLPTMPSVVRAVAPVTPQYWAMDLLKGATARGAPVSSLLVDGAVLLGFTVVLFAVGLWRMRWDRFRHD
jgi:ABC-2 type transport system permease protein